MKKNTILFSVLCLVVGLLVALSSPLAAKDEKAKKEKSGDEFSGSFMIGYRGVDVDGKQEKYKEDYNLQDGPRLFHFDLFYKPNGKVKKLFDSLSLHVYNFGGDPWESFGINVAKYGKFKFKFEHTKSNYFYNDMMKGHDFHTFDFDRVTDAGHLKVWFGKHIQLFLDFERYTKKGNSTTSLDISRDEFEFDKPVDETSNEIAVGLNFSFKGFSLYLEEKLTDYKNDYHYFLPGMSYGEASDDSAMLNYFYLSQPFDFRAWTHTFRLSARPIDDLLIKASARFGTQDLRYSYSEDQMGTSYLGTDFTNNWTGSGEFDKKFQLFDVDLTYLISNKLALVAAFRLNNLEEDGMWEIYGADMETAWEIKNTAFEGGIQYQANPMFGITLGFRSEQRDVTMEGHEEDPTKRTGFFGTVRLKPTKKMRIMADYQYGSYTDPFTPVSATDFHRFKVTGKYACSGYYLNLSYLYKLAENKNDEGWESERSQFSVRLGHHGKTWGINAGYGLIYAKQMGDRDFVFYGSPATWNILYEGRTNMFDGYLYAKLKNGLKLGFYANYYKNDGSWELKRTLFKPYVKMKFCGGFMGELAYRYVKFEELLYGYNDYTANIVEISFGYHW